LVALGRLVDRTQQVTDIGSLGGQTIYVYERSTVPDGAIERTLPPPPEVGKVILWSSEGDKWECDITSERTTILTLKTWLHEHLAVRPAVEDLALIVESGADKYVAEDSDAVMPLMKEGKTLRWVVVPDPNTISWGRAQRWRGVDNRPITPTDYPLWLACQQDPVIFTNTKKRRRGR
jgi:hypothetical protein